MVFTGRDEDVTVGVDGGASDLNSTLDDAIEKLGGLRTAVGLAGAALAGLGAGALASATKAAADFEQQLVELEKVMNPEVAAEMSDRIREMASEMPVAQEELAGIAAQAGRFGVEGSENIEQFTESVSRMAVATDLSTEEAGEAFARMSTLMDEPIDNIENVGSAVNELSNTMATSASEITNSATRSSGALNQLGLQSDQILALNASMNEVSASSRIAGTRLRRFAQELQDPGKVEDLAAALGMTADEFRTMREESPNELMEQMVQRFDEGGESADALREALSTTSRQALAGLAQNTEGWAEAQEAANEQLAEGTSLTEEYEAAADTFNNKIQVLENRVRNAAIAVGEDLLPVATDLVDMITSAIDTFGSLNEQMDVNIGTIALVSTMIGGLTTALVAFAPVIAGAAASVAALAAPALAVAAAVGALWVAWEENLGGIREISKDVLGTITELLEQDLIPALRFAFERVLLPISRRVASALRRNFGPVADEVGDTLAVLASRAEDVGRVMQAVWTRIDGAVVPIIDGLAKILGRTLGYAIDQVAEGIKLVANLIQGDFSAAAGNLRQMLSNLLDFSFDLVGIIGDGIDAAIAWLAGEGSEKAAELAGALAGQLAATAVDIPGMLAAGFKTAITWLAGDGASLAAELALSIFDWLVEVAFDFPGLIAAALAGAGEAVLSALEDLAGWVKETIKTAVKTAIKEGLAKAAIGEGTFEAQLEIAAGGPGVPGAQTGGLIERGGLLNIHEGERVVPAAQVSDRGEVDAAGSSPREIASAVQSALTNMGIRVETGDETLDRVIENRARIVFDDQSAVQFDTAERLGERS